MDRRGLIHAGGILCVLRVYRPYRNRGKEIIHGVKKYDGTYHLHGT